MREFLDRSITRLNNFNEKLVRKYDQSVERPSITICEEGLAEIKTWVLKPNPRFAEVAFVGVGYDCQFIDKIYLPKSGDFSPNSGYIFNEKNRFVSQVDREEVLNLLRDVARDGRKDHVKFLGHLHPSGYSETEEIREDGNIYREILDLQPHEGLLEPSVHDINHMKYMHSFPGYEIPFDAIAANTPEGPKLRVYTIKDLIQSPDYLKTIRNNFPYKTFYL